MNPVIRKYDVVEVKFCGITRAEDAARAVELRARYVGCIFAESPRRVTVTRAREIAAEARRGDLSAMGVFDTADVDEILSIADSAQLSGIQLHAEVDAARVTRLRDRFGGEVWMTIRVESSGEGLEVGSLFAIADGVLLDTFSATARGGTGHAFDWRSAASRLAALPTRRGKLIVAGGLNPSNVLEAIDTLNPNVVDVSSGVESAPGIKDPELMRAFAEAVRTQAAR